MTTYGYTRLSKVQKGRPDPYGLAAQRVDILARYPEAEIHDEEGRSAGRGKRRPVLAGVLASLRRGDTLVVTKLDRLARSTVDFGGILETSLAEGWSLVVLDLGVDMTKPTGRLVAKVIADVAEWERDMIIERTLRQKQEARDRGDSRQVSNRTRAKIVTLYLEGRGCTAIANELNRRRTPTANGGAAWYPITVRKILKTEGVA